MSGFTQRQCVSSQQSNKTRVKTFLSSMLFCKQGNVSSTLYGKNFKTKYTKTKSSHPAVVMFCWQLPLVHSAHSSLTPVLTLHRGHSHTSTYVMLPCRDIHTGCVAQSRKALLPHPPEAENALVLWVIISVFWMCALWWETPSQVTPLPINAFYSFFKALHCIYYNFLWESVVGGGHRSRQSRWPWLTQNASKS